MKNEYGFEMYQEPLYLKMRYDRVELEVLHSRFDREKLIVHLKKLDEMLIECNKLINMLKK